MHIDEMMDEQESTFLSETSDIIQALAFNYLNVYLLQPETDMASIIKLDGYVTKGILEAPKRFPYGAEELHRGSCLCCR
jgi:hypothetical protein